MSQKKSVPPQPKLRGLKKTLRVLITAGPTREFFDPVRFLSNPSSGKMGYAIAEAAARDHHVTLVSGPVALPVPSQDIRLIRVVSARDMYAAVLKESRRADVIIMCAAVSDFRPEVRLKHKLKKAGNESLAVRFIPNPDILKALGERKKKGQVLVGFAAETKELKKNALQKIKKKNLDMIVANHVGGKRGGFEDDHNRATLFFADGRTLKLPLMPKTKLAQALIAILFMKPKGLTLY